MMMKIMIMMMMMMLLMMLLKKQKAMMTETQSLMHELLPASPLLPAVLLPVPSTCFHVASGQW